MVQATVPSEVELYHLLPYVVLYASPTVAFDTKNR